MNASGERYFREYQLPKGTFAMPKYARLNLERREVLERMHHAGHAQCEIAVAIGVHQSTVSRELRRRPGSYRAGASHAHAQALASVPTRVPLLESCPQLRRHLVGFMRQHYSIAQALHLIACRYPDLPTISPQAVYDWLYAGDCVERKQVRALMIRPRTRRRTRTRTDCGRGRIKDMTMIDQRPQAANDRSELGHWEGDIIVGQNGKTAVATLVERMSRLTIHVKVPSRRSADVTAAVARRMRTFHVLSITWDQGKEMADHSGLARRLGITVYFADAHSPWQRGSNENSNGVSRRHLPKGTTLDHSPRHLRRISRLMNDRPMAVLSWRTPDEAYAHALTAMH